MTEEEIAVWNLAKKHLDNKGLLAVSNHLKNGKLKLARFFILGVIDAKVSNGGFSGNDAEEAYAILSITGVEK